MGFYSFYKILKDMLRTLFGKNFIKILITAILVIFVISIYNKCFALSTIPPIIVDGVTFNFNSDRWTNDSNYFTGDMNNVTILRYERRSGGYLYIFTRSSYPIYIHNETDPNHSAYKLMFFNSYDENNNKTYIIGTSQYSNLNATSVNTNDPSYWNNYQQSQYYSTAKLDTLTVIYSNMDVYFDNEPIYSTYTPPSLGNTQTELENLSFSNFIINANSFTQEMIDDPDSPLVMLIYNRSLSSGNVENLYPIKEKQFWKASIYFDEQNSTNSNYVFSYPIFKTGVLFNVGSTYEIRLAKRVYIEEYDSWGYDYFDNSYTFTISANVTQDYINQINQQTATSTDEDNQQQQLTAIENQTQSIDNINNTLTDSSVDSSSIDLPTDNTNDPTQSAIDNIFQTIYNSFTSGTAQDIVFPIPFTDKSITLQANYIYNMLNNNGASWVITIIQAFWWYLISRFIITDIMKKIRKIKQGNFENIQDNNIKEDML